MPAPSNSVPLPVAPGERIESLDALRGLALFGVLMVNLLTEFRVSIFEQFFGPASGSKLDRAIDRVVTLGIESKAFVLFSFLFGAGLAIQFERAQRSQRPFTPYATRRLGMLLLIGLVHLTLVWNGDILTEYALAGFLALPLLRCRKLLLPIATGLFVVYVAPLPYPSPFASSELMRAHIEAATINYGQGTFAAVEAFRLRELPPILALELGVLPRTLGLFALGIWAVRAQVFEGKAAHVSLLRAVAAFGILVGGGGTLATSGAFGIEPLGGAGGSALSQAGDIALGLGYAALLLLLARYPRGERALRWLAPLGRMALSNYLLQSLVLGFVFYGYGLGDFGIMSVSRAAALGLALYFLQALGSRWWLSRFYFGPLEWIWRCATYAARQPLRRDEAS